ncbi:MAG: hypothetical protein F6K28_54140, partial [Microcoleus sp. SIO2G3]|nr:hypothetical protein [Microcoleus sp. SIO2G3]
MQDKLLKLVQQQFGLQIRETTLPVVESQPMLQSLPHRHLLERGLDLVTPNSNESTRRHCIVGQVMMSIALSLNASLFLGSPFEVDRSCGLVGECDYLISRSPLTFRIHPPVALIVEVKRELERGLSHCIVAMAAAQQFNASAAPVYGVVTTGLEWQFLKLEGAIVTVEQTVYGLEAIDQIPAMLRA